MHSPALAKEIRSRTDDLIEIPDFSAEIVKKMLLFVYGEDISFEADSNSLVALAKIANVYDIKKLKVAFSTTNRYNSIL
jgi:hypothetical protein